MRLCLEEELKKAKEGVKQVLQEMRDMHEEHGLLDPQIMRVKCLLIKEDKKENETLRIKFKFNHSLNEETKGFLQKRLSNYIKLSPEVDC